MKMAELARGVEAGDRRTLARAITLCEHSLADAHRLQEQLGASRRQPHIVGITGPPGVGKSTLVNALAQRWHEDGLRTAIIAIDPTSPLSGGALLGDRVRTTWREDGPFFRSLATRGGRGALARATGDVLQLLAAAGYEKVIIETVGAGQSEVGVAQFAQTTVVVLAPGTGDSVQLGKAGLMEFGQIFVVNKTDLPGALVFQTALGRQLRAGDQRGWSPPVVATQAQQAEGVDELRDAVEAHLSHLQETGALPELARRAAAFHMKEILRSRFEDWLAGQSAGSDSDSAAESWAAAVGAVAAGERTAHTAAAAIWHHLLS